MAGRAARAALVDRAEQARAALLRVSRTGAAARSGSPPEVAMWHRAQLDALRHLRAYRAAHGELDRRDRQARRVGREWLEVAVTAHWYRVAEADDAEELARDLLARLPLDTCPRTAGRRIAGAHRSAIALWLAEQSVSGLRSAS